MVRMMKSVARSAVLAPLILLGGCTGLRSAYETDVQSQRRAHPPSTEPITEGDIAVLPDPVQRFIRTSGFVGRGPFSNAEIVWSDSRIRMGPDRTWLKLHTRQFNSVPEPFRIAYMRTRILGVVPLEGKDSYRDGTGRMHMVLMNAFTVGDDRGPEMSQSALVTLLAEALLVPGYILAPYITWEALDNHSARATIRHEGVEASGVFHFDDSGDFVRFRTDDRFYTDSEAGPHRIPWSAEILEYFEQDGLRLPRTMRAVWHRQDGDFEYFRGTISAIRYDVPDGS